MDFSLYCANLKAVALVHLVESALEMLANKKTYTKVPELVLRAGLDVVPRGRVVLRVSLRGGNTNLLVPDHVRRAGTPADLPSSGTQSETCKDDNRVNLNRNADLLA